MPCSRAGVVGSHLPRHQRALSEEGHPAPPEQRSESGHRQDRQGRADDTAHALNVSGVGPSEPGSVPAVWLALISDPLEPPTRPACVLVQVRLLTWLDPAMIKESIDIPTTDANREPQGW